MSWWKGFTSDCTLESRGIWAGGAQPAISLIWRRWAARGDRVSPSAWWRHRTPWSWVAGVYRGWAGPRSLWVGAICLAVDCSSARGCWRSTAWEPGAAGRSAPRLAGRRRLISNRCHGRESARLAVLGREPSRPPAPACLDGLACLTAAPTRFDAWTLLVDAGRASAGGVARSRQRDGWLAAVGDCPHSGLRC